MNTNPLKNSLLNRLLAIVASAFLLGATAVQAVVIVVSAEPEVHEEWTEFLTSHFANVEVRTGYFTNFDTPETQAALDGADLLIFGRTMKSLDFRFGVSAGFNTLRIPIVSMTSFISRSEAARMGWHTDGLFSPMSALKTDGSETEFTKEGAIFFGVSGEPADWHESPDGTFNNAGLGSVGGGDLLCTFNGAILVAHWDAGDAPGDPEVAGVDVFPGERLLFNVDNDSMVRAEPHGDLTNLTPEGKKALLTAFASLKPVE